MDDQLKELISIANTRGSKYTKGEIGISEIPEKIAELGVFLLTKVPKVVDISGDKLREELNEVQQKVDDLRKAIFANKIKTSGQ